jgi:small neutral amino acid transporter SnatA (MarC family)
VDSKVKAAKTFMAKLASLGIHLDALEITAGVELCRIALRVLTQDVDGVLKDNTALNVEIHARMIQTHATL